ncbi:MAG: GAF domain-containing protein [Pseudomonadota bacterium]
MLQAVASPAPDPAPVADVSTFIQATEVWTPDASGERLVRSSGIYGDLHEFAAVSGGESFAYGEGLPGRTWEQQRPLVLKSFDPSTFKRTAAAEAAGLTAGVSLPVFNGDALVGVVVFLCAANDETIGAIEVWSANDDTGNIMALADGYFGAARHFEWISKHTTFPKSMGLPGGVWETGGAKLVRDLGASHRFIRSEQAGDAGITTGLGLPVASPLSDPFVLTLLSARGTPIARRFEVWSVTGAEAVTYADGICEVEGDPYGGVVGTALSGEASAAVRQVADTGAPLAAAASDLSDPIAVRCGYGSVVGFPVYRGTTLAEIVVWYF